MNIDPVESDGAPFVVDVASALDLAQTLYLGLDTSGRVVYCNQQLRDAVGSRGGQLVGVDWFTLCVPEDERADLRRQFDRMVAEGTHRARHVVHGIVREDGNVIEVEWQQAALRRADGQVVGVLASGLEIGTHSALRDSRRELEQLKYALDQSSIVARTDRSGTIDYVNDKFCQISGFSREELIGQNHRIVNSGLHDHAFFKDLWSTIGRGEVWRGEIRNRSKNGQYYWVDTTIVPLIGTDGRPTRYLAIRTEVTARKEQEERLRQQDALAAVGQMAAVVAHEIKNPLMGISGALQVVSGRLPEGSQERKVIGEVRARIGALNHALEGLLHFTRPRAPSRRRVSLRSIVEASVATVRADPTLGGVQLSLDIPEPCEVYVDPELIGAAVLNLLLNAAQATRGRGSICVSVVCTEQESRVIISDDGPGVAPEARERLFEPFFSTKGGGTGLGLAIVQRTVHDHGGVIQVECPESGGTVVWFTVPRGGDSRTPVPVPFRTVR